MTVPDTPSPYDYSRATRGARFAPLHQHALDVLARLASEYDVRREESWDLSPDPPRANLARPSVRLTPRDPREAPIEVAFTRFPGVHLRVGRWSRDAFPACGCDDCSETLESTIEGFDDRVQAAVGGDLREGIDLPAEFGDGWQITEAGGAGKGRSWQRTRISRAAAIEMIRGGPKFYEWRPWTPR